MIATALLTLALQAASPAPTENYRAAGTEQTWSLTISADRIAFETPGRPSLSVTAPTPEIDDVMTRYRAREIEVSIMRGPPYCEAAGGERYTDAVFINIGGRELSGCGGQALPADSLDGTSWHFAEIAGEDTGLTGDIFRDDRYAVDFSADVMIGYGGCNRFSAGYTRTDGTLTTRPPFGMGQRACPEPIMSRERRLFQILAQPMQMSFPDRETMQLTGDAGTVRLRRARSQD